MSRQFYYNEMVVVSEDEIRTSYYPKWKMDIETLNTPSAQQMKDQGYPFEECLEDWVAIHWATEFALGPNEVPEQLEFSFS